jgi:aminoglycoside phosphotransferase (APT) family kinase protein
VKVPRLIGSNGSIAREAENLTAIHAGRPAGFASIPRVVAFEEVLGRPLLVETALSGRPMDRSVVRGAPEACCDAVANWLTDVHQPRPSSGAPGWFERLVEEPLEFFETSFPLTVEERQLVARTRDLVAPLRQACLPLVFEHGDLSHPNVLLQERGIGVVDWELAQPWGMPGHDLFFFLCYVALARHSNREDDYLSAFDGAFFGRHAWASPYVSAYAEQLHLPKHLLTPLFIVCWARYTIGLLERISGPEERTARLSAETVKWLRSNRYYAMWRYAVTYAHGPVWSDVPRAVVWGD